MPHFRRPSPSMIVALTALVVALGGSAYAAGNLINGNKLKKFSVPGNRLKKNSLTGAEINESKLGVVPNAAHARFADSATRATHAASADSALSASDAAHATSADKLGGLVPGAFVQGGGQTFAASKSLAAGETAEVPAFDIPGIGTATLACSGAAGSTIRLRNETGQSADSSDVFAADNGTPVEGGGTIPPNGNLIVVLGNFVGQMHLMALWPAGTSTHAADFTVAWYRDPAHTQCTAIVAGVAH